MQPLFTFGDLVLDVVATVEAALDRDTDTPGQVRSAPGGSAANFAVWTRRLDDEVRFAGRVGTDLIGRALADDMRQEGIETFIAEDPVHPTPVLVLLSENGQRHMMVPQGACHYLDAEDLPEAAIRTAGWLHVTGYSFFWEATARAAERALAIAREEGIPISFDPSSAGFIRRRGLRLPDGIRVLIPNGEEALSLTGCGDVETAARQLAERAELVAVKLGAEGVLLAERVEAKASGTRASEHGASGSGANRPGEIRLTRVPPATPPGPVVDGTGAGDAWGAAFVHGLRRGLEPYDAARRANLLGARIVTRVGARPPIDVESLWRMEVNPDE